MARTRMENGVEVALTPEEETARDAEEKAVSYTHLTLPTILLV